MVPTDRRLTFLIRFATMELPGLAYQPTDTLGTLRGAGFPQLRRQLLEFLLTDPGRVHESTGPVWGIVPSLDNVKDKIDALSFAELGTIHKEVRQFLFHALEEKVPVRGTVPQNVQVSLWFPKKGRFLTLGSETLVDHFRLILSLLVVRGAEEKLCRCKTPDCEQIFVRSGKKEHCTKTCGDKFRQRKSRTQRK